MTHSGNTEGWIGIGTKHIRPIILILSFLIIYGCDAGCDGETLVMEGYVELEDGSPVEGVEVVFLWPAFLGDWEATEVTDETGWYGYSSEGRHPENSVTITPTHRNYDFSPINYGLEGIRDRSQHDLDFVAIPK